ncbi:MAG: MBL fold metallo-hydrolase [Clostridiaceae bacterium]|nr:MBL fold metallo-hydrolase [Clostridiaceae bacterium]MBW4861152.1 MBL fold metallo-hydrolase [Clostridiaceae bacterium]MBW4869896.1 MBL fold metallo-hydrolase [Clostridiaceae bacterium]
MNIKKVRNRGILFTFHDLGIPTNVYAIYGEHYTYIIDTYLGPDIIKLVGDKPIIVVNTHSHWDHVWENSLYFSS